MYKNSPEYQKLISEKIAPMGERLGQELENVLNKHSVYNSVDCLSELEDWHPYEIFFFACSYMTYCYNHDNTQFSVELLSQAYDYMMDFVEFGDERMIN